jgi:hypothetical protein
MPPSTAQVPKLPGYQIKGVLGKGANGVVYRAVQLSMQRDVAIKFLSPAMARIPGYIDNFVREARSAAKLSHPNIILGIDVGEHEGHYYFVMEYVEGKMLRDLLRERKQLPEPEALRLAAQIALALDHAHRHGFVHRDVKPANIMVTPQGVAKLCDLGLAVSVRDEQGKPRSLAGTPYYIAPEQARVDPNIDIRADLYALGATLYHALVGEPPFKGETPEQVIEKHLKERPVPPRERRPALTARTSDRVMQMLQKDPAERPQSPLKLSEELQRCAEAAEAGPARRSVAERVARRGFNPVAWAAGIVALSVVAGGIIWAVRKTERPVETARPKDPSRPREIVPAEVGEASREYDMLKQQVDADPTFERLDEILRAIDQYAVKHGGAWGLKATNVLKADYLEALDRAMQPQLEAMARRERELFEAGRWREALAAYEAFPPKFLDVSAPGKTIRQRTDEIRRRIRERTDQDQEELARLLSAGRPDEARQLLARMEAYVLNPDGLSARRREIADLLKARADAMLKEADEAYVRMEADFRRLMAERRFAEAGKTAIEFLRRPWKPEQAPFVSVDGFDPAGLDGAGPEEVVARCEKVYRDDARTPGASCVLLIRNAAELEALTELARRAVAALAIGGSERVEMATFGGRGFFRTNARGEFEFTLEGQRRFDVDVLKFKTADTAALAARTNPDARRHLGRSALAYFYSGEPEHFARATELMAQAAEQGYPGAKLYALDLARVREARLDEEIQTHWAALQQQAKEGRWLEAEATVAALKERSAHPKFRALGDPFEKLSRETSANAERVRALQKELDGTVATLVGDRATIVYDFAVRAQFDAFEHVTGGKLVGRWGWEKGLLRSSDKLCALEWRRPIEGDVTVAYDLTAKECHNIITTLYYNPSSDAHYNFTFGLDVVVGKDDPNDTMEDREKLPRYCILKFPARIPGGEFAHMRRSFWTAWRDAMVGDPVAPFKLPLNEPVRVTVERAGESLRLKAGSDLVWEGKDAEYRKGRILFMSHSRVTIQNLSITFRVGG